MSTPATIKVGNTTFYQSHDGYPNDVIPEMEIFVKKAKKIEQENPDFSLRRALITLLKESDYVFTDFFPDFYAEYEYEITENGEIKNITEN